MPSLPPTHDPRRRTPDERRRERQSRAKADKRKPWRAWYRGARWKRERAAFITDNPLCERCLAERPPRYVPTEVVNHRIPHNGDYVLFWDSSNWEASCYHHHNKDIQTEEKKGSTTYGKR